MGRSTQLLAAPYRLLRLAAGEGAAAGCSMASGSAAACATRPFFQHGSGGGGGSLRQACVDLLRRFSSSAAAASTGGGAAAGASASVSAQVPSLLARGIPRLSAAQARPPLLRSPFFCGGLLRGAHQRLKSTAALNAATAAEVAAARTAAAVMAAPSEALSARLSAGARRALVVWLGGLSVWVYSMVVLGGITRLTRSGLSMTEWKLAGERPPLSQADWETEFTKYRASPEYQKLHRGMSLAEFKFIYWMEYAHRMWGRLLGIAFAVPATYFAARRWISGALARRLGLLFFMGGTQGLVGWWMVRSGLEAPEHEHATPRVSPYRLAAHLVSAFAIYATLAWTTLDLMYPKPATVGAAESVVRAAASCRSRVLPLAALIAVTATSGAFVAGLDAGRAYNTWPLMGGRWVPEEYWAEHLPALRNIFENTAAVQFDHRMLATASLLGVAATWLVGRKAPLPPRAMACLHGVAAVTGAQFLLGIYTLLEYVPAHLGSMHQANALNLFTAVLALLHALRPPAPGPLAAAAGPWVAPAAALLVAGIGYTVVSQNGVLVESPQYTGPEPAAARGGAQRG